MTQSGSDSSDAHATNEPRRRWSHRVLAEVTLIQLAALCVAIVSVVLFALLARAVLQAELSVFNRSVLESIHLYATPTFDRIALMVTWLGSVEAAVISGVILAWILLRAGRRIDMWTMVAVLGGGGILSQTLKSIFAQARPDVFDPLYQAAGLSFPSGHSLISYCLWGFIATWLLSLKLRTAWHWFGAALCILIATAVAFSRLYIGVHWPSDVVGGMLVAAFWLAACFLGRQYFRRRAATRASARR